MPGQDADNLQQRLMDQAYNHTLNSMSRGDNPYTTPLENERLFEQGRNIPGAFAASEKATDAANSLYTKLADALFKAYADSMRSSDYSAGFPVEDAYSAMRVAARDPQFAPFYSRASDTSAYANNAILSMLLDRKLGGMSRFEDNARMPPSFAKSLRDFILNQRNK